MTSQRKTVANKQNARRSTGPRTDFGKARSALNARTHGLSSQPVFDAETEERIAEMAEALLEDAPWTETTLALARTVAEAQIWVERVAEAKRRVWEQVARHPHIVKRGKYYDLNDPAELYALDKHIRDGVLGLKPIAPHLFAPPFQDDAERDAEVVRMASVELTKLIRYERRATNQRDKAMRSLAGAFYQFDQLL